MNIRQFLQEQAVDYEVIVHSDTFEAQRMAHEVHVSGHEVAKTVLLSVHNGSKCVVAVLPASRKIDLDKARQALNDPTVAVAPEQEIQKLCPDCEKGALPPFGRQYGTTTLVDRTLTEDEMIVFEANTHHESIRMALVDYVRLENPDIVDLAGPAS